MKKIPGDLEERLMECFTQDRMIVPYRPQLAKILNSINSAILLQQIIYRWIGNDCRPFYKFKEPGVHSRYRPGDSWVEELEFSRREFDAALKNIAIWKKSGVSLSEAKKAGKPVIYWRTRDASIYYTVNVPAALDLFRLAYKDIDRGLAGKGDHGPPNRPGGPVNGRNGSGRSFPQEYGSSSKAVTNLPQSVRDLSSEWTMPSMEKRSPRPAGTALALRPAVPFEKATGVQTTHPLSMVHKADGDVVDHKKAESAVTAVGGRTGNAVGDYEKAESVVTDIVERAGNAVGNFKAESAVTVKAENAATVKAENAATVKAASAVTVTAPDAVINTEKTKKKLTEKEFFIFWEKIKTDLVLQMPADTYDFLMPYLRASLQDGSLVITGPPVSISWIDRQYLRLFTRVAAFIAGCYGLEPPEIVLRKREDSL